VEFRRIETDAKRINAVQCRTVRIARNIKQTKNRNAVKNAVFLDVMLCGSCKNRRFEGAYRLLDQGDKNR
jgi:hypothetical protein